MCVCMLLLFEMIIKNLRDECCIRPMKCAHGFVVLSFVYLTHLPLGEASAIVNS